jgi:hypothetical protein
MFGIVLKKGCIFGTTVPSTPRLSSLLGKNADHGGSFFCLKSVFNRSAGLG